MQLVSVIIPVYQVESYIALTIRSVLAQTYQHWEMLIVDDGSTDQSREICQQFTDSRIKIITQDNQGVSAARNSGIRAARGEFLAFLDADDLWLPEKLENHLEHLNADGEVGLSFSSFAFIDQTGKPLSIAKMSGSDNVTRERIFCRNPIGNPSCVVIRRETMEAIKITGDGTGRASYFDEDLNHFEDVELWLRIACKTDGKIAGIPKVLNLYRINDQGASSNWNGQLVHLAKMSQKTSIYAPDLTARCQERLKAYAFRKFAQWAVHRRESSIARMMIHKAIMTDGRIFLDEPLRTLIILGAVYTLSALPRFLYNRLESIALGLVGTLQKIGRAKNQHW